MRRHWGKDTLNILNSILYRVIKDIIANHQPILYI